MRARVMGRITPSLERASMTEAQDMNLPGDAQSDDTSPPHLYFDWLFSLFVSGCPLRPPVNYWPASAASLLAARSPLSLPMASRKTPATASPAKNAARRGAAALRDPRMSRRASSTNAATRRGPSAFSTRFAAAKSLPGLDDLVSFGGQRAGASSSSDAQNGRRKPSSRFGRRAQMICPLRAAGAARRCPLRQRSGSSSASVYLSRAERRPRRLDFPAGG